MPDLLQMSLVERMRLLSETFAGDRGAMRLAQLLSTFVNNPNIPVTTNVPLTMRTPEGVAPFNVNNRSSDGDPLFTFTNGRGGLLGTISWSPSNGVYSTTPDGQIIRTPASAGGGSSSTGNVFPATIISGSSNTYSVDVFRSGRGGQASRVSATHPQIGTSETIPAGTKCQVVLSGSSYEIIGIPVWLE